MAEVQFNGGTEVPQVPATVVAPVPLTAEPTAPVKKRGPGRPRKTALVKKRGPGRPRKTAAPAKRTRKAKRVAGVKLQTQVHKRVEKFYMQYAKENNIKPSEATRQVLTKFAVKHGVELDA